VNSGYVSYREEAREFWIRIIQGRGQGILVCVSYREEASEFWIRMIEGRGQ
jgi:hypothetical protein